MNCLSINIRRFGGNGKCGWIKGIKNKEGIIFISFQETQCSGLSEAYFRSFWGSQDMEWDIVEPTGRSGGLACVWDPGVFTKISSFKHSNFLLIKGKFKGRGDVVNVINVYAPQRLRDKKSLWEKLLELRNADGDLWLFMGDFNAVRIPEDRLGSIFNPVCARAFNNFICEANLHEYEMKGGRFTFFKEENGIRKLSKIDRVLVGNEFFDKWPMACLRVLPRLFSDHCPLLLAFKEVDFGPKPFRVYNSWLDRNDYVEVVSKAWNEAVVFGAADTRIMLRLKHVREQLKVWRDEFRNKEDEERTMCKAELEEMDAIMEEKDLNGEERWIRSECYRRILELEDSKAKDLKQKSRIKWAIDGDENSRFFHGFINKRKSINSIPNLVINGAWEDKPKLIKKQIFGFFRDKFREEWVDRPKLMD
uniref:uncharacterized protein LOC122588172 n=1 Tax=Erigeron canadensis TaxID=72917 RepID=UPI001CB9AB14|nr:uncharacterized protein LOC122588172 [Erigeron canadensis]